ncbi:MAG: hypothetical protein QM495_07970 [Lutibacter sp.]|uniref:hypothetical protein n=1 Tax=Lutibacter sp. TaxID=1925666 RepID=UPI00385AAAA0
MKKFYSLIIALLIGASIHAQTDGISYQAVILNPQNQELLGVDASGTILPNTAISIRFTITNDNGGVDYQEIQNTTTDSFGIINLFIGEGTQTGGVDFTEINWDGLPKNLEVDIDFKGGNNFVSLGNQKLTFVPYAYHRDITASGDLTVEGETNFKKGLNIDGEVILNNKLTVKGETKLENELLVSGEVNLGNNLMVSGNTTLNKELTVNGDIILSKNMSVVGVSTFENKVSLKGDMDVDGQTNLHNNLTVDGDAVLNQSMSVVGTSTFDGKVVLKGDMDVDGQTNLRNNLTVDGDAVLNQNMSVVGTSTFDGKVALKGDMDVDGQTNLRNNLTVDGDAVLNQSMLVVGTSTFEGKVALKGDMDVDGQTNLHNNLTIDGDAVLNQSMSVVGTSTFDGKVVLKGDMDVDGQTNLRNNLTVDGVTNLNNSLNVTNGNSTNLSGDLLVEKITRIIGELNVDGVANLNSDLNVGRVTNLVSDLNVGGNTLLKSDLTVEGTANFESDLTMKNLVVKSDGGAYGDHVALFENTNSSNGNTADGIAIRIQGNVSNKLGFRNRFITFYGNDDYIAGRIESYDLLAGDLWESFPIPDFGNLINIFDFSNVLTGGSLPSLTGGSLPLLNVGTLPSLNVGTLPSLYRGRAPSLSINFTKFEFNFDNGSLPRLTAGSFPTLNGGAFPTLNGGVFPTLNVGSFPTLDFNGFWNPTAAAGAASDVGAMVSWGMRNGNPGFMPETPWGLALVPLVLAAKQVAMNQGVIYGSKGADYAEWLEKEDLTDKFVFGEVVGVKGGKISRNTTDADQVMSISLAPIVLGNMPDEARKKDFEKVGFMGQVPVLTLGNVEIGDYIIASGYNDGYAKAVKIEELQLKEVKNVIGKAWSSSNGQKVSLINVSVGLKTNEWVEIMKKQENRLDKLESKIEKLEKLIKSISTF